MAVNFGLLLIRVIVGLTLAAHGAQKLFGWFGGGGLRSTAANFEKMGYRPGNVMALLAGLGEAGGGALVALGLLTPLGAAAGIGVMLNAIISVHVPNGFWNQRGGFEYPLTIAAVFAGIAFAGSGGYSLDAAIGWRLSGIGWGIGAVLAAAGAAAGALLIRSRALREVSQPS